MKYRTFPRYFIPQSVSSTIEIVDMSFSGLRLKCLEKIIFEEPIASIKVCFAKETFNLKCEPKWIRKDEEIQTFYFGVKFFFDDVSELQSWLTFIKAMHLLRIKQQYKKSFNI